MESCSHNESGNAAKSRRLLWALGVIVVFMVIEFIGGFLSGSLALLADATHMLTDAFALALAAGAHVFASRPADSKLHFGYRRAQVLAAFVNGVLMAVLLLWIVVEAAQRFMRPIEIDASLMLWVAVAGLFANLVAFFILHRKGERDLNIRGAMLHVLGDLFGSVAAIVGALIIMGTGWLRIDPILSIFVAILIGISAIRLLRETGLILLEGAPSGIDTADISASLVEAVPGVRNVHHIRIWQITPDQPRLTLHVEIDDPADAARALRGAKEVLASEFRIHHSTIQIDVGGDCPDRMASANPAGEAQPSPARSNDEKQDRRRHGRPLPAHEH